MQNQNNQQIVGPERLLPEQENGVAAGGPGTQAVRLVNRGQAHDQGVPQLLRDLRHVYNRPKSQDRTQGQHMLRKLIEKRPEKFLDRLQKAEAEYRASVRPETAPKPVEETDENTVRVIAKLEQLLREKAWEKQQ